MRHSLTILSAALLGLTGIVALNDALPAVAEEAAARSAATEATVAFAVENMTCATCPITVRTVMGRVEGVSSVMIDYASKTATVVFDPSVVAAADIAKASTDVGYPATLVNSAAQ